MAVDRRRKERAGGGRERGYTMTLSNQSHTHTPHIYTTDVFHSMSPIHATMSIPFSHTTSHVSNTCHYVHTISDICCIAIHIQRRRSMAVLCHPCHCHVYGNTAHIRNGMDIVYRRHTAQKYRIAGIFRGVKFSWFS